MTEPVPDPQPAPPPTRADPATAHRILGIARRIGAVMLASGAQTAEIEGPLEDLTHDLGLADVQVNVTFSSIAISHVEASDRAPTTVIQLVRDRSADFTRLAAVAVLLRDLRSGRIGLAEAEAGLDRIEAPSDTGPAWLPTVSVAVSAAAIAILFGGEPIDAIATLGVALVVQPFITLSTRAGIPPFFNLLLATAIATLLSGIVGEIGGLAVQAPIIMTASLLRFLPGAALVAGVRDLIDQEIISGTARLAEALMVSAGVAAGATAGILAAAAVGIEISLGTVGTRGWGVVVEVVAALVAVGAYGIRLSVPRFALPGAALLGAAAWAFYSAVPAVLPGSTVAGTLLAATVVGAAGRIAARRWNAPAGLWVAPAILMLLPGLALVQALLAPDDALRIARLWDALLLAFVLGVGVAAGDIVVVTLRRAQRRLLQPAVGAVARRVEVVVSARGEDPAAGEPGPRSGGEGPAEGHGPPDAADGPSGSG